MRRKKDDKRVLRSGNGRQQNSRRQKRNRRLIPRGQQNNMGYRPPTNPRNPRNRRNKRKRSKKLIIALIIALLAFVIGAGIGISLTFDNPEDDGPHYENVTKEMTSNLSDIDEVYYDKSTDDVDYNQNQTSQLDISYQYTYN